MTVIDLGQERHDRGCAFGRADGLGAGRDPATLPTYMRADEARRRERRIVLFTKLLTHDLDGDPDRLTRIAAACRVRHRELAGQGDGQWAAIYARGAMLADRAVTLVRAAEADTDLAARARLLDRIHSEVFGDPDAGWWRHTLRTIRWVAASARPRRAR